MTVDYSQRWAWAEVSASTMCLNFARMAHYASSPRAWAVIKADAYGHGAAVAARAATDAGAQGLCVALAEEGAYLRNEGIPADILLLSEQPPDQSMTIVENNLIATVASYEAADALNAAGVEGHRNVYVHIKVDTGMHRVGIAPDRVVALAQYVKTLPRLRLEGIFTHFAVADEPERVENVAQRALFEKVLQECADAGIEFTYVHAANTAATLADPASHYSFVRVGIAMYGLVAGDGVKDIGPKLLPAMSLKARVSAVRRVSAGEAVSYGLKRPVTRDTIIATVPIGYADGVPRKLWETAQPVLIGGVRRPIAGVVTMDQIMVDCGDDDSIRIGDEVVLFGEQGGESIAVREWAQAVGTNDYEIVCGISPRIKRVYT
jgi:alanine racemase